METNACSISPSLSSKAVVFVKKVDVAGNTIFPSTINCGVDVQPGAVK